MEMLRKIVLFASLASISIVMAAAFAPIYQELHGFPSGEKVYSILGHVCHQYPTRSVWILNRPMALCTRCVFGYTGLFIYTIALVYASNLKPKWSRIALGFSLLGLAVIDPLVQLLTVYESTNITRAISGMIGGTAFGMIILPFKSRRDS
jgi:uncharacterized membrane protein